jgi:alpha-tubulin suppressor-like RCC1 family protein
MTGQNTHKEPTPMKVQLSRLAVPSQLACGEEHCSLVTQSGNLWTWGYGNDGQLGQKNKNSLNSPKQVRGYTDVVSTSCGGGHSAFILKNGELYMFGRGRDGQLGRGDVIESMAAYRTEPVRTEYLFKNEIKASQIALGANHSIALVSMGK